jgi:hypothetical protein
VTFASGCARFVTMPNAEGVAHGTHDDGYRRGGLLSGERGVGPPSKNDVYVEADEIVCQLGKSLVVSLGVAMLEANVLALDIAKLIESLFKGVEGRPGFDRQDTDCDYFPSRLLRPCRNRPRRRAAAPPSSVMNSRRLVCRESSIVKGDGGRFMTPPPSRLEARRRLGS